MVSTHRGAKKELNAGKGCGSRWEQGVKWSTAPRASTDMQNVPKIGKLALSETMGCAILKFEACSFN